MTNTPLEIINIPAKNKWFFPPRGGVRNPDIPFAHRVEFPGSHQFYDIVNWVDAYVLDSAYLYHYEISQSTDFICLYLDNEPDKNKYISYLQGFLGIPECLILTASIMVAP